MSNAKIWLTADLHINHNKLAIERGFSCTEDHDNTLIDNFKSLINPNKDTLIVLGDVVFGKDKKENKTIREVCNARYVSCVLGNHDKGRLLPDEWNLYAYYWLFEMVMSHIPVTHYELKGDGGRYKGNIHGHLHQNKIPDPRYLCVSLEQTNMRPILASDASDIIRMNCGFQH